MFLQLQPSLGGRVTSKGYKLPALKPEQEKLVRLVVEHLNATNTLPRSTWLMLDLGLDIDSFESLLDSVPSVYLHKPAKNSNDESVSPAIAGLGVVPGCEPLVAAFVRLFRVAAALYIRRPHQEAVLDKAQLKRILRNQVEEDVLKFLYALRGGHYPGLMRRNGKADGEMSVTVGLPVLEYRAIRSLEDYYQIQEARKEKAEDQDAATRGFLAAACQHWRETDEWPLLIDFAVRHRNHWNVVRLLEELQERLWHRTWIQDTTDRISDKRIHLKIEGVLAGENSSEDLKILVQIIKGFVGQFEATEGNTGISYEELARALNLPKEVVRRVGLLLQHEAYSGVFFDQLPNWVATTNKAVTRYKGIKDVAEYIARRNEQGKRETQRSLPKPEIAEAPPAKQSLGQYTLLEEIGRGANGIVWKAEDAQGVAQAIKLLNELDEQDADRLKKELKLAATLRHDGLVTYLSTELEVSQGQHYVRMELIKGSSLKHIVGWNNEKCIPQSADQFIYWFRALLPPLSYMHAARVVHRDLHAGNIMLTRKGALKIVDYGSARVFKETEGNRTFAIPGTYNHSAPEVWEDPSSASPSSDFFSLGVISYLLMTGKVPFWAGSVGKLHTKIAACDYINPKDVRAELPAWLDALIRTLLLKDPEKRWHDAGAIGQLLELAEKDPAAADQLAQKELEDRSPKSAGTSNPWAQYGLPYRPEGGTPVLTGQEIKVFSNRFPDRYVKSAIPKAARLILDREYVVAGYVPGKNSVYLEPVEASGVSSDDVALSVSVQYQIRNTDEDRHDYDLLIVVTNTGRRVVDDYLLEVEVPSLVLSGDRLENDLPPRKTRSHTFFQLSKKHSDLRTSFFPGKTARTSIPYHFDDDIHREVHEGAGERHNVRVTVYADGIPAKKLEMPLDLLNNY
jgi:serine/threonine protein kinase